MPHLHRFFTAAAILLACASANAQNTKPPKDNTTMTNTQLAAQVMNAFEGLVDASKALDSRRYFDYIDKEKFSGISADGKVWQTFKDLEMAVSTGFNMVEKIATLEFSNVKVTIINPSTAILVNEYKQTILLKNKELVHQFGAGTQVWSKYGNAWKLVSISDASHPGKPGP